MNVLKYVALKPKGWHENGDSDMFVSISSNMGVKVDMLTMSFDYRYNRDRLLALPLIFLGALNWAAQQRIPTSSFV